MYIICLLICKLEQKQIEKFKLYFVTVAVFNSSYEENSREKQ